MATLIGTQANDELLGTSGDDLLQGRFGADVLYGDAGNDTLEGGDGDFDQLYGGPGDDLLDGGDGRLDFAFFGDAPGGVVVDLEAGTASGAGSDTLRGIEAVHATDFDDTVAGSAADNLLRGFAGHDLLRGLAGRDLLVGDAGNDTLDGGAGDLDDLSGGAGDDWLDGGDGVGDEVDFATAPGAVRVDLAAGTASGDGEDTLRGFEGVNGSYYDDVIAGDGADNALFGGNGSDWLQGRAGDDALYGDSGNDTLEGGAGERDFLRGGAGDDWLDGGDGLADMVTFTDAFEGVRVDLESGVASGEGQDTVRGIEIVEGSPFSDVIAGNALANILYASFGHDLLRGRGGDDRLVGALGNDTLEGGDGIDTAVFGGAFAGYRLEYVAGVLTVTDLDMGDDVGQFDSTDTLWQVELLEFTDRTVVVDELFPDPQRDEVFDLRGIANGRAAGRGGDDRYLVDGVDDLVEEVPDGGADRVEASIDWALGPYFETLRLTGSADLQGAGNAGDNRLSGNGGANRLRGGGGDDTLEGGAGRDTLAGGPGNDTYVASAGDRIVELPGEGVDRVYSALPWTLRAGVEELVLTGSRSVRGTGSGDDNTILGNAAANRLVGLGGDDVLRGRGGDDLLAGGAGDDTLQGGPGADAFRFDDLPGPDAQGDFVTDFRPGTDRIELDGAAFAGLPPGALDPARFLALAEPEPVVTPLQRILYDARTGALYYDADGAGAAVPVQFALLGGDAHPSLSAADFFVTG